MILTAAAARERPRRAGSRAPCSSAPTSSSRSRSCSPGDRSSRRLARGRAGTQPVRGRARRGIASIARSMSSSVTSRCVTARRHVRVNRDRQPDARGGEAARSPRRSSARAAHVDLDEVRLDLLEIDRHPGRRQAFREPPGARVVVGEPLDVVLERVHARQRRRCRPGAWRRRRGTSSAAPTRISSGEPARSAPSGQPSPLERQSVTVSKCRPIPAAGTPERDRRVQQPRAVEVHARAQLAARLRHRRRSRRAARPRPPARVVRVLERDHARQRGDECPRRSGRRGGSGRPQAGRRRPGSPRVTSPECTAGPPSSYRRTCECSSASNSSPGSLEDPQRDLVRHRGRRQEHGLLLAEQRGSPLLELEHGRVLALLLVADDGVGDRRAHAGGGLGQRVRAEVDHGPIVAEQPPGQGAERHRRRPARPGPGMAAKHARMCADTGTSGPLERLPAPIPPR